MDPEVVAGLRTINGVNNVVVTDDRILVDVLVVITQEVVRTLEADHKVVKDHSIGLQATSTTVLRDL